ncbi:MAG: phosphate signaling complex protein PhoU [Deltaproteobacteria bacterium]|nr:phosphate signaling complex protein PhoU [Deltaproteobacteria bacterium]
MTQPVHTNRGFEHELTTLRERILLMGGRAEEAINSALGSLEDRDVALAERVKAMDDYIDRDELEIDELAQTILATRQPVASDLRFITMSLKIVTDLERIGDLAANIAKRSIELVGMPPLTPGVNFGPLAKRVQQSLREALDSFVERNADKALAIIEADREIDAMNAALFSDLISRGSVDTATLRVLIPTTSIARSLERIGDHAKNLAEEVVYMVRGRDVRHRNAIRHSRGDQS